MTRPTLLILNSTSLHFPNRYDEAIAQAGHPVERHDKVDSFLASRHRSEPFLALFEIGSSEDLERALIAYDWVETVQPLAPVRFLLLLASKNIDLGERRRRFSAAETLILPLPAKNILFKIDLQLRLLQTENTKSPEGFFAQFEGEARAAHESRVLVMRGPGPGRGAWKAMGSTPEGKVRWRWVQLQQKVDDPPKIDLSWEAVSTKEPVFDEARKAWVVKDEKPDLRCFRQDKEVFSARRAAGERSEREKRESKLVGVAEANAGPIVKEAPAPAAQPDPVSKTTRDPRPAPSSAPIASEKPAVAAGEELGTVEPAKGAEERREPVPGVKNAKSVLEEIRKEKEKKQDGGTAPWNVPELKNEQKESFPYGTPSYAKDTPPASPKPEPERGPVEQAAPPAKKSFSPATKPEGARDVLPESGGVAKPELHSTLGSSSGEKVSSFSPAKPGAPTEGNANAPSARTIAADPRPRGLDDGRVSSSAGPERQLGRLSGESDPKTETIPILTKQESPAATEKALLSPKRESEGETGNTEAVEKRKSPVASGEAREPPGNIPDAEIERKKSSVPTDAGASIRKAQQRTVPVVEAQQAKTIRAPEPKFLVPQENTEPSSRVEIPPSAANKAPAWTVKGSTGEAPEAVTVQGGAPPQDPAAPRSEGESLLASRLFLTMTLQELKDEESSWHPVDRYRIYLSARHRYYGVKNVDEFFPLWVYEGELAPEFLDKTRGWKFYDRLPEPYYSLQTLPAPIAAYLRKTAGLPEEEKEKPAADAKNSPSQESPGETRDSTPVVKPAQKSGALEAVWAAIRKLLGLEQ